MTSTEHRTGSHAPAASTPVAPDGRRRIEVTLRNISALFNSLDPSPFRDKDLDAEAEAFIVSWAQEYPVEEPLLLRIHMQEAPAEDPTEMVRDAVRNYFRYRRELTKLEFRHLMKQGRTSLLIGIAFLGVCLIVEIYLLPKEGGHFLELVRESLTIAGWVAMWRPMQIYLYDWWPLRRRGRIFAKLSRMSVELVLKQV